MHFTPIRTRPLLPPQDDIFGILDDYVHDVQDGDVIFITSKIVAIHQARCIHKDTAIKKDLIIQEADAWMISDVVPGKDIYLTRTHNILIPSAGIDESNGNGYYILRPTDMSQIAQQIHAYICTKH
jgi:F420-0:gamma-glutamyl ligase